MKEDTGERKIELTFEKVISIFSFPCALHFPFRAFKVL
jgi:hypothetical protein